MKKAMKTALLACLALLACALMFTSCDSHRHEFHEWTTIKEATCEEAGLSQRYCSVCNYTESQPIEALEHHDFHEWTTIKEAKCEETGLSQRYCSVCNYTESQPIEALGHDSVRHEGRAPICCLAGWEPYETCTRCDYTSEKNELPALEHSYDAKGFCTVCHDSEKFRVIECFDYEVVIGAHSTDDFVDMETLIIPAYHNGKRITHIGGNYVFAGEGELTFLGLQNLKTLIISEGIEEISWRDFRGCDRLVSITLPKSIKRIDETLFFLSLNLREIHYDGTKEQWLAMIADPWIPITVTVHCTDGDIILNKATESTPGLEMTLKDDGSYECTGIGTCTANNLIITTYQGRPVTGIAEAAFNYKSFEDSNYYIAFVVLGDSVKSIGDRAFSGRGIYGISLGQGLKEIGQVAFSRSNLTYIQLPDSIKSIEQGAFYETRLIKVVLPSSLKIIPYHLFYSCRELTSITIPQSVLSIERNALAECTSVQEIVYDGTIEQWNAIQKVEPSDMFENIMEIPVICTNGKASW